MGMRNLVTWTWPWRRAAWPRPAAPSRTSQVVALARATMDRPHTAGGDPRAQQRLCAGMRPAPVPSLRAHLAARTRFFDEQVLAAIGRGTRQVVILGAGYDDRALRFRSPGVRYTEVDHPATQADKRRRLAALAGGTGPVLAAADFRAGDVPAVLAGCGHDADLDTLFICEGLLVYLEADVITGLLRGLRSRAAPGSVLAASLAVHPDGADAAALAGPRERTPAGGRGRAVADDPAGGRSSRLADRGGLGQRSGGGRRGADSRRAAAAVAAGHGAARGRQPGPRRGRRPVTARRRQPRAAPGPARRWATVGA